MPGLEVRDHSRFGACATVGQPVAAASLTARVVCRTDPRTGRCAVSHRRRPVPLTGIRLKAEGTLTMSPANDAATRIEFDQFFIDMNLPHHASIVASSGAVLPRLQDKRLRAIAIAIILEQAVETQDLRALREKLYGDSTPQPVDASMMEAMQAFLGDGAMDPKEMMEQLDPATMTHHLSSASTDALDRLFVDLVISHHQSAVMAAQAALDQAQSEELRLMAAHSLHVQQSQIQELQQIRKDLAA